jgi:hypothetical protein
MRLRYYIAMFAPAVALASLATMARSAKAPLEDAERARCATRLSIALTGRPATPELLANADPQSQVDALLASPAFVDQFARFTNSKLNDEPGMAPADDAAFFLAKYILENGKPWRELFDGAYRVEPVAGPPVSAQVVADPAGLGFFRSRNWMVRYAGNEEDGYRLSAAFRIQQNIIGLDVAAVTNAPGTDVSAGGRMATGCRGCHYDAYFALDKVAKILSRRTGPMNNPVFVDPTEGPQVALDGHTLNNDADLVKALVESTDHQFRTCRLAFQFLYGRNEATCEAELFDQCIDAYAATGDVRATLKTIAQAPGFCE